jgi:CMP/dCMP kinase
MIIAVDGPAASGKGTVARRLAAHYGLPHLDTGLLYRAVGIGVLRAGQDPSVEAQALAACGFGDAMLHDPSLKSEAAGKAASIVSAHPAVRAALFERQKAFAAQVGGAVLDGRDIGTVICPHADVKIFVTASPEERARRRTIELRALGQDAHEPDVLADILRRDERDRSRTVAPLRPAEDAHVLDTTKLDIEGAVAAAIAQVERARP